MENYAVRDVQYTREQKILLIMCWCAYVSTYICRLNYSAVMPEISTNSHFNNTEIAGIGSAFFITYGFSQIINGFLGDKLPARWMIFVGLFFSAICNIFMFLCSFSLAGMIVCWAINGFFQSMIWSPLLKIGGEYYEQKKKERFGLFMSTTVPVGTLISYFISMILISFIEWRYVFLFSGLMVLVVSIGWIVFAERKLIYFSKPELEEDDLKEIKSYTKGIYKGNHYIIKMCIATTLICLLPIAIHGALKDGVCQFIPIFIVNNFEVNTSFSLLLTMLLPVFNTSGAFIAKWLNKYIKNELILCMFFFGISLLSIVLLYFFSSVNLILTIVLLALVTNSMFAINLILISFVPLKFSKYGKTSTMSGILNSIAYIGCSFSMLLTGKVLDLSSWKGVYMFWFLIALVAILVCIIFCGLWKKKKDILESKSSDS